MIGGYRLKIQCDVRACLALTYDRQYFCFKKIVDDVKEHFKKFGNEYPSAMCDKQRFEDIVQAYQSILRGVVAENLIAGLKRFGT